MSEPTHLGRYRIVSRLGAGAMGDVFLAEDPQIDRLLAIKTVKLHGSEEEVETRKQRLLVEARAAGRLVHPHVVTLFDAGEDAGTVFLAFEYVEGQDLGIKLKSGAAISLEHALQVTRQTALALQHAHRMGIVHRDIKPSNIMLTVDGEAKIGDFGIAKLHNQETNLTSTGMLIGTPHYMSPEQVRGETLDGRSDVFSLGSVLFELLHRRRPFPSDTLTTLVYQILHEDPTEGLRDNLPVELADLLRRMLAKDLADRPGAGEVAADVERLLQQMSATQLAQDAATVEGLAAPLPPPPVAAQREEVGDPGPADQPAAAEPVAVGIAGPRSASQDSATIPPGVSLPSTQGLTPEGTAASAAGPSEARRWLPWLAAAGCLGMLGVTGLVVVLMWMAGLEAAQTAAETAQNAESGQGDSVVDAGQTELPPAEDVTSELGALDEIEVADGPVADDPGTSSEDGQALDTPNEAEGSARLASADSGTSSRAGREPASSSPPREPVRRSSSPQSSGDPSFGESASREAPPPAERAPVEEQPAVVSSTSADRTPAQRGPAEDLSALAVDQELQVSTAVGFRIQPDDVFVLFRRPGEKRFTNIGRSRDYDMKRKRRGAFQLPGPGSYLVVLRREGLADYRIRLTAVEGTEPSLIEVRLSN